MLSSGRAFHLLGRGWDTEEDGFQKRVVFTIAAFGAGVVFVIMIAIIIPGGVRVERDRMSG